MINLVFEDTLNFLNFKNCKDKNSSTIRRFSTSPLAMKLIRKNRARKFSISQRPENYLIAASVNHSPSDWAKKEGCLIHLDQRYLSDIRNKKAMIMFDQSLEGYQTLWLWEYFHNDCQTHNVNPSSVIYVTGNMLAKEQYKSWADEKNIIDRIHVISYPLFEHDVFEVSEEMNLDGDFEKIFLYKKQNIESIKSYSCVQKRLRNHRIWFYNYLYKENLLDHGIVSMNYCEIKDCYLDGRWLPTKEIEEFNKTLPRLINGKNNNEFDDNYYIRRITDNVFKNSWVSVISEALFSDNENSVFLSEKIFKPIACMQPFIILGNKNSLKYLKQLGYRTFEGVINESYDNLNSFERFDAIIDEIKRIIHIQDKLSWYRSMEEILDHNYKTLCFNSSNNYTLFHDLEKSYKSYFKL
jgi:hypothetical protein